MPIADNQPALLPLSAADRQGLEPVLAADITPPPEPTAMPSLIQKLRGKFEAGSILRAMLHGFMTVAGLTLMAKAVSFFKDADVARRFGVSDALDAFGFAFGAHTFACSMLGGGLPDAFLPAYSRLKHEHGPLRAERLGVQTATCHGLSLLLVGLVVYAFAPQLVGLLAQGFPLAKQQLAMQTMRDLLPFLICYGMTMHLAMWLRGNKLFAVAAAAPIVVPATILVALAATGTSVTVNTLVWGTNIGGAVHLLILATALSERIPWSWSWLTDCGRFIEPANRMVFASAGPYIISGLVLGGAPIVDQVMAARLESGSVTVLSYSDKVCSIILALTASAAGEALFPFFADVVARREWPRLKRQLLHTIGIILTFALPLVGLLCWQAPLVVKLLFQRGSFDQEDTERVATVLRCGSLQIPFYIASVLMAKVVVALQANWFTLATATLSLVSNILFNLLLMRWFGVAGIALSTAFVYLLSATVLYLYVMRTIARLSRQDLERGAT